MRVYKGLLLLTLLAAISVAAFLFEPVSIALRVYFQQNLPSIPLPPRPEPHDRAEANWQDVQDLKMLPSVDRSFSAAAKTIFYHDIDALAAQAGSMSPAAFEMEVSRLVALAGNAHTSVSLSQRAAHFGLIPLRFAWFSDGLYVVRAMTPFADLLGAKIVTLDGRSPEQALSDVGPYISGTEERDRADSTTLFETPQLLEAIWPDADGVRLTLKAETGQGIIERQVTAMEPANDPFAGQPVMVIGPRPIEPDEADWKTVLSETPAIPLSLQQPDRVAFSAPLEKDGIYVRINANGNDKYGPLTAQLASILAGAPPGGWRWFVLDLRFNDGGDELKTMDFARALPSVLRSDGSLYILTGNATFSAAIITAARAKYFVGKRAHIVGEKIGDHDGFWTDGGAALVLRNSGIVINHAYFLHDWINGCASIRNCHPYSFIYGVAAGDLSPEITVGWRFADYAAGRDTVMETVRALAAQP